MPRSSWERRPWGRGMKIIKTGCGCCCEITHRIRSGNILPLYDDVRSRIQSINYRADDETKLSRVSPVISPFVNTNQSLNQSFLEILNVLSEKSLLWPTVVEETFKRKSLIRKIVQVSSDVKWSRWWVCPITNNNHRLNRTPTLRSLTSASFVSHSMTTSWFSHSMSRKTYRFYVYIYLLDIECQNHDVKKYPLAL